VPKDVQKPELTPARGHVAKPFFPETVARKVCYSRRLRALCKTSEIA
jgi:hypothetical protein